LVKSDLKKTGDDAWASLHAQSLFPHDDFVDSTQTRFFSGCLMVDFSENDAGEYRAEMEFEQPLTGKDLSRFEKRLACDPTYCSASEAACYPLQTFRAFHHLYFQKNRLIAVFTAFLLLTLLLGAVFTVKKILAHAT
jgi:hypothetical protein